jgi:GDPmannose 4,6-dehydratase
MYGQDGSYLAEYLLGLDYEVLGLVTEHEISHPNARLFEGASGITLRIGDLMRPSSYTEALAAFAPDEVYNLAALSDLKAAAEDPVRTMQINAWALRDIAECVYAVRPDARIFQALSSRLLKPYPDGSIDEQSPWSDVQHPYDVAKLASYTDVVLPYRTQGHFIASGYLCNHESPRRGTRFVTGKIAEQVALISKGEAKTLYVGNVEAKRDWSFAGDFVRAMHAILAQEIPDDYVIGSSSLRTVKDFITEAFGAVDITLRWEGEALDTRAYDGEGILRVAVNPDLYVPDDNPVVSNTEKLKRETKWSPQYSFEMLVRTMVEASLEDIR